MKKHFLLLAGLMIGMSMSFVACDDDDDDDASSSTTTSSADIDYTSDNASSWGNYMVQVGYLLQTDAASLYEAWNTSYDGGTAYAEIFKDHNNDTYSSALTCVEEILDGCSDIANEVGDSKIGDPIAKWNSGSKTEALYAVESWYSWHSRDDYTNNIYSIRNSYYGSLDGTVATNSLSALVASVDADRNTAVIEAINAAAQAIQDIPQPFRNNIGSDEAVAAQEACADLVEVIDNLKAYIRNNSEINTDEALDAIVTNYVDEVVLPTYESLQSKNAALYKATVTFNSSPSDANFEAACEAWLAARQPWEQSEAFLFGPVDALGLDPNMDSWPLDQDQIVQILNSGSYDELNWSDSDDDDAVEAAQSVRGFHTLEFLIFKDGNPRSVNN